MSRTIQSPGVEIKEFDSNPITSTNFGGTTFFVQGFADKGPLDEPIYVSSLQEFENIYGLPTNQAERYFYHTVKPILANTTNVIVNRLPYGENLGDGFGTEYTALVYPVTTLPQQELSSITLYGTAPVEPNPHVSYVVYGDHGQEFVAIPYEMALRALSSNPELNTFDPGLTGYAFLDKITYDDQVVSLGQELAYVYLLQHMELLTFEEVYERATDGSTPHISTTQVAVGLSSFYINTSDKKTYFIEEPKIYTITQDDYEQISNGDYTALPEGVNLSSSLILINKRLTTVNDQYEGIYAGLIDNSNVNPSSDYNSILSIKTLSEEHVDGTSADLIIPSERINFALSSTNNTQTTSISKILETATSFDLGVRKYDDNVVIGVFKLRKDIVASEAITLNAVLRELHVGSLDYYSKRTNPRGGEQLSNYIKTIVDQNGLEVSIIIPDEISGKGTGTWLDINGLPKHKVRFVTTSLLTTALAADEDDEKIEFANINGVSAATVLATFASPHKNDSLVSVGIRSTADESTKICGDIPGKLEKSLSLVDDIERIRVDVIPEAGLGTIHVYTEALSSAPFDDTDFSSQTLTTAINGFKTSKDIPTESETVRSNYLSVANVLIDFCEKNRKDCITILDPLRWFFVEGTNRICQKKKGYIFSNDLYWPLKHITLPINTSFAEGFPQWVETYDSYTGGSVWVPYSGVHCGKFAQVDSNFAPWRAAAGFVNGVLSGITNIALKPNQAQRDLLYKIRMNPVSEFNDGFVVISEKTMLKRDTVFSNAGVRRMFLLAERSSLNVLKYFLMEPNDSFTRKRAENTIIPILEKIKDQRGLYDYQVICDERNNTAQTIDEGEMYIKVLIKPMRNVEFIIAEFYGTNMSQDFSELI